MADIIPEKDQDDQVRLSKLFYIKNKAIYPIDRFNAGILIQSIYEKMIRNKFKKFNK
jgi:hypothetical protein